MASFFRARRPPEDGGSGRKMLSGRRRMPAASPCSRPQSTLPLSLVPLPAPPPPPAQNGSPSWLLGLISSAGKMISSAFCSEGSSSYSFVSSSGYSSDGDFSSCPEEDIDALEDLHKVKQHDQEGKKPDLHSDGLRRTKDIIQVSESKLVIEHLLMQETFSREEGDRLIKMIKSRVVDSQSMRFIEDDAARKLLKSDIGIQMGSCGLPQSFTHTWGLPKLVLGSPFTATGKCLDEKEMASDTNQDFVRRLYPLKTQMLHQDQDEVRSPVDLAKSYMQSLKPHHSPSSRNNRNLASQPNGLHQTKDESTHTMANPSPSLKVFKRKYPHRRSQEDCQRSLSMSADKDISIASPVTEGAVRTSVLDHESSIQNIISSEATRPEIKMEPASSLGFDEDKLDVIEPLQKSRKHDSSIVICHENPSFSSTSMVLMPDEHKTVASDSFQFRDHSKDNLLRTLSCKDEPELTGICEGLCEYPNVPAIKIYAGESHTGTRMRSLERKVFEPLPGTARGRRKSKARTRRGRGRK